MTGRGEDTACGPGKGEETAEQPLARGLGTETTWPPSSPLSSSAEPRASSQVAAHSSRKVVV